MLSNEVGTKAPAVFAFIVAMSELIALSVVSVAALVFKAARVVSVATLVSIDERELLVAVALVSMLDRLVFVAVAFESIEATDDSVATLVSIDDRELLVAVALVSMLDRLLFAVVDFTSRLDRLLFELCNSTMAASCFGSVASPVVFMLVAGYVNNMGYAPTCLAVIVALIVPVPDVDMYDKRIVVKGNSFKII